MLCRADGDRICCLPWHTQQADRDSAASRPIRLLDRRCAPIHARHAARRSAKGVRHTVVGAVRDRRFGAAALCELNGSSVQHRYTQTYALLPQ